MKGTTPDRRAEAVREIVRDVDDALRANGVDEEDRNRLWNSAVSAVRREYYNKFWRAVDE